MDKVSKVTGRDYRLFDYVGAPDAEKIIIIMGSGADTADVNGRLLMSKGEKVGVLKVRLYRPFSVGHFGRRNTEVRKKIAVLDRTKESGSVGEPLYVERAYGFLGNGQALRRAGRRQIRTGFKGIHTVHGQGRSLTTSTKAAEKSFLLSASPTTCQTFRSR